MKFEETYEDIEKDILERLRNKPIKYIKYYVVPSHIDGFPTIASEEVDEVDWNDDKAVYARQELIK